MGSRAVCERHRRPRLGAAGLALLFGMAVAAPVASAGTAADPVAVMRPLIDELDLQGMPAPAQEAPVSTTRWQISAELARTILFAALVCGVGFALHALRDTLPGWRRPEADVSGTPHPIAPAAEQVRRMEATAADADALAAEGRFAEAMHVLLLRSLLEVRERCPGLFRDAWTSREILRRASLPSEGPVVLRDLIDRVEPVHFGRRPAAPEDYRACRTSYARLLDLLRTGLTPA